LTYEEAVALVGPDRYAAACDAARRNVWPKDLEMVPHDLHDLWDDHDAPLGERLDLALRVLREMPCYANTMQVNFHAEDLAPADLERLWAAYRDALDGDDERLADTVSYSLWVDFFEDQAAVAEAWAAMIDSAPDIRIGRLIAISGPVPWELKAPWYGWLGKRWRPPIADAIRAARGEVYGQVDEADAARFL
jgi:hypothetical protein